MIDRLLKTTQMQNGEREVKLHSVIVHETDTGYAQCFKKDAYNVKMGEVNLNEIILHLLCGVSFPSAQFR